MNVTLSFENVCKLLIPILKSNKKYDEQRKSIY